MKRILLLLPGAFETFGGIQLYNRLLIKAFGDLEESPGALRCTVLLLNDFPQGIDRRYFSDATAVKACSGSKVKFVIAVARAVISWRPDVVIFGHVNFAPLIVFSRLCGARSWVFVYGIEFWHRLHVLTRTALRMMDRIISISEFTLRKGVELNGIRKATFHLVPCALDPLWESEFRASADQPRNGDLSLLTVARLSASEKYKGIDVVIRALPSIAQRVPSVKYVIVGDGDDRPRLERLARDLDVEKHVQFRGRVDVRELGAAYRNSAVFVMPSSKEGFGIVFLEAAFFEMPSIGARFGGIPEVVDEQTGVLVEYGDVNQIAEAAIDLLLDRDKCVRLGTAARARQQDKFSFGRLRENIRQLVATEQ